MENFAESGIGTSKVLRRVSKWSLEMLRIRHRAVLVMGCAIAGVIGFASSASAEKAVVVLQAPGYYSQVFINPTSGGTAGIDLQQNASGEPNGAPVFPDMASGSGSTATGFGYTNGTNPVEYYGGVNSVSGHNTQALTDAIIAGGNTFQTGYTATTDQGISSSFAAGQSDGTIGWLDNAFQGAGIPYYSNWQGIDLTASGPTGGKDVTLVAPTWLGDATLRGYVNLDDYIAWDAGNSAGLSSWQSGNFLYEPTTSTDSYIAWDAVNSAFPNVVFPGFGTVTQASALAPTSSVSPVPEPATWSLLDRSRPLCSEFFVSAKKYFK